MNLIKNMFFTTPYIDRGVWRYGTGIVGEEVFGSQRSFHHVMTGGANGVTVTDGVVEGEEVVTYDAVHGLFLYFQGVLALTRIKTGRADALLAVFTKLQRTGVVRAAQLPG